MVISKESLSLSFHRTGPRCPISAYVYNDDDDDVDVDDDDDVDDVLKSHSRYIYIYIYIQFICMSVKAVEPYRL
jgi:hypothetical protein